MNGYRHWQVTRCLSSRRNFLAQFSVQNGFISRDWRDDEWQFLLLSKFFFCETLRIFKRPAVDGCWLSCLIDFLFCGCEASRIFAFLLSVIVIVVVWMRMACEWSCCWLFMAFGMMIRWKRFFCLVPKNGRWNGQKSKPLKRILSQKIAQPGNCSAWKKRSAWKNAQLG